jgi:FlaA1/EpsC-like NDP-sugar epimerase
MSEPRVSPIVSNLTGKRILVDGGCGSIGSQLVRRILDKDPHSVRVFDVNERGLFEMQRELEAHDNKLRFLLGDIRDRDRLALALEDVDVVFHTAALKHVELNEYNPFEAVQTNVQGTQNLIRMAIEEEVERFIAISTDKASHPTSVMGATKLLAERLVVTANMYKGPRETRFSCVRFGNVLGSSGSVVPVFLDQLASGGPLTVTDPDMTRFIMPIDDAVDLVLQAQREMRGGEVFVLKMPTFKLEQLVEVVRTEYAPRYGYEPDEIAVEVIGRRPGERMHEKLISGDELAYTEERENMFILLPQIDVQHLDREQIGENSIDTEYTSADPEPLSHEELTALIQESGLLTNSPRDQ